jgi:hypothetical protein
MTEAPQIRIQTTVEIPGLGTTIYTTSASISPEERPNPKTISNILSGHISLLDEELNSLKETK